MPRPFIMAAPNGARRTSADHPILPVTIPHTVETAIACHRAGADALHLHVRDDNQRHSLDAGLYREAMQELDEMLPDLPVQITTESGGIYPPSAQLEVIEALSPEWISLSIREATQEPAIASRTYNLAREQGTEIQHILYDAEDATLLADWQRKGAIGEDASVILVLGRYAADMNSDTADLAPFVAALPSVAKWMVCAFGPNEHACLQQAARMGGDLRVGFENSFQQADGTPWADNAASVAALIAALDAD